MFVSIYYLLLEANKYIRKIKTLKIILIIENVANIKRKKYLIK